MDQRVFVAQLNIKHFLRRLDGQLDEPSRHLIERLLAEEEAKLSALRAAIAEGILSRLLDLLASWASGLADNPDTHVFDLDAAELSALFDEMPCAMCLVDRCGNVKLANEAMRRFVGEARPSRDPRPIERWRVFGSDGHAIDPTLWPGVRALRGETVNPGLAALHMGDDGRETPLRIAGVPVRGRDGSVRGAIAAAYELSVLERREVHDRLERLSVDERLRPPRQGRESGTR